MHRLFMMWGVVIAFLCLHCLGNALPAGPPEQDLLLKKQLRITADSFVGTYEVLSDKLDQLESVITEGRRVEIKGDKFIFRVDGNPISTGVIRFDPTTREVGKVDLSLATKEKIRKLRGIYSLHGEKLYLCFAHSEDRERPQDFSVPNEVGPLWSIELKRVKP